MLYAQLNADKMVIRSPVDGLSVLNLIWKEGQMAEVRGRASMAWGSILQVVNPAMWFMPVNQVDTLGCDWASRFGEPGRVPDLVLSGKLEQISLVSAASGFSQRVRNCAVTFSLQEVIRN
jgi:hypothetical protein